MRRRKTDEELAVIAANYDSLKLFREEEPTVEREIRRRGLAEKLCGHMKRDARPPMSEDDLAEIASHYDSIKEFCEKEWSVYVVIHRRGLKNKLCGHMVSEATNPYSDKELAEVASRYDAIGDLRDKEPAVYSAIHKHGLYEKLCGRMESKSKKPISDKELAEIASKYYVLKEFIEKEPSAYSLIHRRGLMEKLCGHMERGKRHLTDEQIAELASHFSNRKDFREHDVTAYSLATHRGILDKVCAHMERLGNFAKRKIYVFTFSDGYAYVGLSQDPKRRYRQHLNGESYSPVRNHIKDTGATFEFSVLTDWLYVDEASIQEDKFIKQYAADGWKMLNRVSGGAIGTPRGGYTKKLLQREADKYQYVEDFKEGSPRYYKYIVRNHLFKEYCSSMKRRNKSTGSFTATRA